MIDYVLVSQGVEIYRTKNWEEAKSMQTESNDVWKRYVNECLENGDVPADNEVFLYEEVRE